MSVIFLGIVGYLGSVLYERAQGQDWLATEETEEVALSSMNTYPGRIKIESLDGRVIEVTLLARNQTHISFLRGGDGQRFVYPMASLTSDSQAMVLSYPDMGINIENTSNAPTAAPTVENLHVQNLKTEIGRIDEKIARLKQRFNETKSKTDRRTIARELEALALERAEHVLKISARAAF